MTNALHTLRNLSLALVWLLIAVLAIITMLRDCGSGGASKLAIAHDTIRVKADSIVVYRDKLMPVYLKGTSRIDTLRDTLTRSILVGRETTRQHLESTEVHELLVLDSSATLPLSLAGQSLILPVRITDTCDCIARSVRTVLRITDTTMLIDRHDQAHSYALGVGISAGITSEGHFAATLAVSLSRILALF